MLVVNCCCSNPLVEEKKVKVWLWEILCEVVDRLIFNIILSCICDTSETLNPIDHLDDLEGLLH